MSKLFKDNKPIQTESQVKYQKKFIDKANRIHNEKYDYSKVVYKKSSEKVCIICPVHGKFWQRPSHHMNNRNCPKCAEISRRKNKTLTTQKFIKRAIKIHKNKYDYSKVEYKNIREKVCIICPIHGIFQQTPMDHLQKCGCPKCAEILIQKSNKYMSTKAGLSFIKKSKSVHGNKYDYSKVEYVNAKTKVTIICPIHGEFEQTPGNHLNGSGCPICGLQYTNYTSGKYQLKYPEKYSCDINMIVYRSSYELKAFEMIEEDENIISWESETVKIPYKLDGKQHKYIVDLKIETKNGVELIEIKPYSKTIKPKYDYDIEEYNQNQAKWIAAKEYCKEKGWEFEIWTEKELGI